MLSEGSSRSSSGASTPIHDSSVTDSEPGGAMSVGPSASAPLPGLQSAVSARMWTDDIPTVKAICCVGAGYVGKYYLFMGFFFGYLGEGLGVP
jgi:hypothetical protein